MFKIILFFSIFIHSLLLDCDCIHAPDLPVYYKIEDYQDIHRLVNRLDEQNSYKTFDVVTDEIGPGKKGLALKSFTISPYDNETKNQHELQETYDKFYMDKGNENEQKDKDFLKSRFDKSPNEYLIYKAVAELQYDNVNSQKYSFYFIQKIMPLLAHGLRKYKFECFIWVPENKKDIDKFLTQKSLDEKTVTNNKKHKDFRIHHTVIKNMIPLGKDAKPYPNKDQQKEFKGKWVELKYFGYWDKPGDIEIRAACRHSISSVRRAIEAIIELFVDYNYILDNCPKPKPKLKQEKPKTSKPPKKEPPKDIPKIDPPKIKRQKSKKDFEEPKPPKVQKKKFIVLKKDIPAPPPELSLVPIITLPPTLLKIFLKFSCFEYEKAFNKNYLLIDYTLYIQNSNLRISCQMPEPDDQDDGPDTDPDKPEYYPSMQGPHEKVGLLYFESKQVGYIVYIKKTNEDGRMNLCIEIQVYMIGQYFSSFKCQSEYPIELSPTDQLSMSDIYQKYYNFVIEEHSSLIDFFNTIENSILSLNDFYNMVNIYLVYELQMTCENKSKYESGRFIKEPINKENPFWKSDKEIIQTCFFMNLEYSPIIISVSLVNQLLTINFEGISGKKQFQYSQFINLSLKKFKDARNKKEEELNLKLEELKNGAQVEQEIEELNRVIEGQFFEPQSIKQGDHYIQAYQNGYLFYLLYEYVFDNYFVELGQYIQSLNVNSDDDHFLANYLQSDVISHSVYSAFVFNVIINMEYERLYISEQMMDDINTIYSTKGQDGNFFISQIDIPKSTNLEFEEITQEKLLHRLEGIYNVNDFETPEWFYLSEDDKELNVVKFIKDILENNEFMPKRVPKEYVQTKDNQQKVMEFDLQYLSLKEQGDTFNMSHAIFGQKKHSRKTYVYIWNYKKMIYEAFHLRFTNFYFTSDFIIIMGSSIELYIHTIQIINEVEQHLNLMITQSELESADCSPVSFEMFNDVVNEYFKDHQRPKGICKKQQQNEKLIFQIPKKDNEEKFEMEQGSDEIPSCSDGDFYKLIELQEIQGNKFILKSYEYKPIQLQDEHISELKNSARPFTTQYTINKENGFDYRAVIKSMTSTLLNHYLDDYKTNI